MPVRLPVTSEFKEKASTGKHPLEMLKAVFSGFTGIGDRPSVMQPDLIEAYDTAEPLGILSQLVPSNPAQILGASAVLPLLRKDAMRNLLKEAQLANTYTYADRASEYGRRTGYPQQRGTPVDKLFSNFADNSGSTSGLGKFREAMLYRAKPKEITDADAWLNRNTAETLIPFNGDKALLRLDNRGKARISYPADSYLEPEVAAMLERGYLDSIAVDSTASGQSLGEKLLRMIDEQGLGNIHEVADRSPGFVKIQKKVLSEQ